MRNGGGGGMREDLELEVKTLRELQTFNEATINELKTRVKELEEEGRRRK